jgi:SAM-dependent methyltransferase
MTIQDIRRIYNRFYEKNYGSIPEKIIDYLEKHVTGKTVLDLGCGDGVLYQKLGSKMRAYFGVDISPKALEKSWFKNKQPVARANIEKTIVLTPISFDVVVLIDVINETDPQVLFSKFDSGTEIFFTARNHGTRTSLWHCRASLNMKDVLHQVSYSVLENLSVDFGKKIYICKGVVK